MPSPGQSAHPLRPRPHAGKPLHHLALTRPQGHTFNSAMVRLRLYRLSVQKVLRELLTKTVTTGAETPDTSISLRRTAARTPVRRLTPAPPDTTSALGLLAPPSAPGFDQSTTSLQESQRITAVPAPPPPGKGRSLIEAPANLERSFMMVHQSSQ